MEACLACVAVFGAFRLSEASLVVVEVFGKLSEIVPHALGFFAQLTFLFPQLQQLCPLKGLE